jgi:crossover junction endodeoxyribonuclease RusA
VIVLELPFPPSVNTYYRRGAHATYMSKAGREYKQAVAEYVSCNDFPKFGNKRLSVSMVVWPRDRRVFDIDNRIKSVLDSLQDAGLFDNDSQIDELSIYRGSQIVPGGSIKVMIEEIK